MKPPLNNGIRVASNSMKIISYQNITFKKHPNILLNFIVETYGNKFILPFFTTEFGILNKLIGNSLIRLIFICLNSFFCKVRCLVDRSVAAIDYSTDAAEVVGHIEHRSAWGQSAATECGAFQCQRTGSAACAPSVHERPLYTSPSPLPSCAPIFVPSAR